MKTILAIYENGVLRPAEKLELPAGTQVELLLREPQDDPVTVLRTRYPDSFGGFSPADGEQIMQAIDEEFERIDPDAWK